MHVSGVKPRWGGQHIPPLKLLQSIFQASHELPSYYFQREVLIRKVGETVHFLSVHDSYPFCN